jgi:hypothetical protein
MKKLSLLLLLSIFIISRAQENSAFISIYSTPENAQIRINSVIVGTTPLEKLEVEPGLLEIEAIAQESGIWHANNFKLDFFLSPAQDTIIHIKFPKIIKINSVPYHARLLHQDHLLGLTPVSIDYNEYRGKELLLEKNGYKSFRFLLEKPHSEMYHLEEIDLKNSGAENNSVTYSLLHSNMKSKFLFLSGTVVTHWMAFYLKNLADDNFERYQTTGDPALMKKYWDNTQKYDRWSDITLGVSYAFLGGLIYTVLWR